MHGVYNPGAREKLQDFQNANQVKQNYKLKVKCFLLPSDYPYTCLPHPCPGVFTPLLCLVLGLASLNSKIHQDQDKKWKKASGYAQSSSVSHRASLNCWNSYTDKGRYISETNFAFFVSSNNGGRNHQSNLLRHLENKKCYIN